MPLYSVSRLKLNSFCSVCATISISDTTNITNVSIPSGLIIC